MAPSLKQIDLQIHAFENYLTSIPLSFKNVYIGRNLIEFSISLENQSNREIIDQKYGRIDRSDWLREFMTEIHAIFPDYKVNHYSNSRALRIQIYLGIQENSIPQLTK
jgi:hypothetical protein